MDHDPIVRTGALVCMTEYSPRAEEPDILKTYYAQVKWIKQISESKDQSRNRIRVKYCTGIDELVPGFSHNRNHGT